MKLMLTLVLSATFFLHVSAQLSPGLIARVDSLLDSAYGGERSGASVLIAQKNQIIYHRAFGKANLEAGLPMSTEHITRIGSVTKQFTAVAILKLAEEGKLSLQDPLTKYLPDYSTQGHVVTVEHLLTHTSGIVSYTDMPEWTEEVRRKDFAPLDLINTFKVDTLEFAPGTAWNYNNTGYFILGYIIEKVSGQSYSTYLQDHFFTPLQLKNTLYGDDRRILKHRAIGYQKNGNEFAHADYLSMTQPYAAGSLMSTTGDLFTWHKALHAGKIISASSLKLAFTDYILANGKPSHYGYGFFFGNLLGSPTIEHSGGINGYLTQTLYLPQEDIYIAILTNCECDPPIDISAHLAATILGKNYFPPAIPLAGNQLKDYSGVYASTDGERYILFREGKLYTQRPGGSDFLLVPYGPDAFYLEGRLSQIKFIRNSQGKITGHEFSDRQNLKELWTLTDRPIPEMKVITVEASTLQKYLGSYELQPGFVITLELKGQTLWAQATGQPAFELQPISQTRFKTIGVDAQIEFATDASGMANSMTLHQGGRHMPCKKIK